MLLATHDKPFLPENLVEKFRAVRALGFDSYEADGALVLRRFDELKRARDESGLALAAVCGGYRGWIGHFDKERRREAVEDLSLILGRLTELGARCMVVPAAWGMFSLRLPPMTPPRDAAGDRKALLDSLSRLEDAAQAGASYLLLEPLNRYEDHMINQLETAAAYIEEGGFERVKICADFYHMNIEEARIEESLEKFAHLIAHVHLADSQRFQPGTGHIDYLPGLLALKKMGYAGAFSVECRVTGSDPQAAYARSAGLLRGLLAKAGYGS